MPVRATGPSWHHFPACWALLAGRHFWGGLLLCFIKFALLAPNLPFRPSFTAVTEPCGAAPEAQRKPRRGLRPARQRTRPLAPEALCGLSACCVTPSLGVPGRGWSGLDRVPVGAGERARPSGRARPSARQCEPQTGPPPEQTRRGGPRSRSRPFCFYGKAVITVWQEGVCPKG